MKKLSLIITISALMAVIVFGCKTKYPTTTVSAKVIASPGALARGKVLAYSVCAGCHYNRGTNKFIGNRIEDVPSIAGKVFSANLTHSKTNGVMEQYTDAEVKYLLKTGINKNGHYLAYMLRPNMADADIDAIIAFFRSDDPALTGGDTTVGLTDLSVTGKLFMNLKAKPIPYRANVKLPAANTPVKLGYYLVDNLGCFHCHSKSLTSLNYLNPNQTKGYLAGGIKFKGESGQDIYAPNITPDKNGGIGDYSETQFYDAMRTGHAPDRQLKAPMPKFPMLSKPEIIAIYAYLQTVPAKYHVVKKS